MNWNSHTGSSGRYGLRTAQNQQAGGPRAWIVKTILVIIEKIIVAIIIKHKCTCHDRLAGAGLLLQMRPAESSAVGQERGCVLGEQCNMSLLRPQTFI